MHGSPNGNGVEGRFNLLFELLPIMTVREVVVYGPGSNMQCIPCVSTNNNMEKREVPEKRGPESGGP